MGEKKKPNKDQRLETIKSIIEILAGIADIGFIVYAILKG